MTCQTISLFSPDPRYRPTPPPASRKTGQNAQFLTQPLSQIRACTPTLPDEDQRTLGRLHPSFMGGEYLPNRRDTEVEIARINIDSTTSHVTSVYDRPSKDRIYCRVVDEYRGDTLSEKRTRSSKRPLSLGELITFFLAA